MGSSDTRQRLIDAAADLMLRKGYQSAGVDELCRRAGAQKGSFYHFFAAKADLALAALELRSAEIRQKVFDPVDGSGPPGLDRLRRFVDAADALQRQQSAETGVLGSAIGGLGQEMAGQDERIRAAVQAALDAQAGYIRRWLEEAVAARQLPPGDNAARARDVLALVEGAFLLARISADPDMFRQVCTVLPAVAGKPSAARPAPGTAPELA